MPAGGCGRLLICPELSSSFKVRGLRISTLRKAWKALFRLIRSGTASLGAPSNRPGPELADELASPVPGGGTTGAGGGAETVALLGGGVTSGFTGDCVPTWALFGADVGGGTALSVSDLPPQPATVSAETRRLNTAGYFIKLLLKPYNQTQLKTALPFNFLSENL